MHHPHNTPLLSADPQATAARSLLREVRHPNSVTAPRCTADRCLRCRGRVSGKAWHAR